MIETHPPDFSARVHDAEEIIKALIRQINIMFDGLPGSPVYAENHRLIAAYRARYNAHFDGGG